MLCFQCIDHIHEVTGVESHSCQSGVDAKVHQSRLLHICRCWRTTRNHPCAGNQSCCYIQAHYSASARHESSRRQSDVETQAQQVFDLHCVYGLCIHEAWLDHVGEASTSQCVRGFPTTDNSVLSHKTAVNGLFLYLQIYCSRLH